VGALFGDKNTRLYCVGPDGTRVWSVQLSGRGIFHAPAVCRSRSGGLLILQVVRTSGGDGPSLYALDGAGKVVDSLALPGGGGAAPLLCRFGNARRLSLVTLSGSGELQRRDLPAPWSDAEVVWAGPPLPRVERCTASARRPSAALTAKRVRAVCGVNDLTLTPPAGATYASVRVKPPVGPVSVSLYYLPYLVRSSAATIRVPVLVSERGEHDVSVQWMGEAGMAPGPASRYTFVLDRAMSADAAMQAGFEKRMTALAARAGVRAGLVRSLASACRSRWEACRPSGAWADVEALRRERERCAALAAFVARAAPGSDVALVQVDDPWRTFDPVSAVRAPCAANRVSVRMLGNEDESAVAALINLTERAVVARVEIGDLRSADGTVTPSGEVVALREPLAIRPFSTGRLTDDPLPLLGETATIRLQPGEARPIWFSLNSRALKPGRHRATIRVGDVASFGRPAQATLEIGVSSVRLPDRLRFRHCNWLSPAGIAHREMRRRIVDDALAHRTSVFIVPPPAAIVDAAGDVMRMVGGAHDELAAALKGRAFLLVTGTPSLRWPGRDAPTEAARDAAFAGAVRAYGAHMDALGWPRTEYALYLQDEPGLTGLDAQYRSFVDTVRKVKAADPRMPIYANPAGGARAEILRPLVGLVDVWCPDLHLYRGDPDGLDPVFRSGREWWNYEAPGDQRNLDPLGFYRMQAWVAFKHGMQGAGYWVHSYDPYWFDEPGGGSEYGAVYVTDGRPVPSKRWEATRDGIEDYELLSMTREAAERMADPSAAFGLIAEAVAFVTSGQETTSDIGRQTEPICPDYGRWMEYRRRLIEMVERLLPDQAAG